MSDVETLKVRVAELESSNERLREALREIAETQAALTPGWVHWRKQAETALSSDERKATP